jgi:hypothetical protein
MRTLKIELKDNKAYLMLKEMEDKHLIRIVKEPDLSSYALPGEPMSEEDFKEWAEYANDSPTLSFAEAREIWATQKEKLQKLIQ